MTCMQVMLRQKLLEISQDAKAKLECQRRVLDLFDLARHDSKSSGQNEKQEKTSLNLGTARTLAAFQEDNWCILQQQTT